MPPSSSSKPEAAGQFHVLYFASAASYACKDSELLQAPLPLSRLFDVLEQKYAGMRRALLDSCAVTINLDYVEVEVDDGDGKHGHIIEQGDEVAIIPPVSSG